MTTLTDTAPPYQPHSETSYQASVAAVRNASTDRSLVLETLRGFAGIGLTDEAIQFATKLPGNTERPRRIELCRKGLVVDSGKTRKTTSGRMATVWEVK